jgi:hypothetical protein
MFRTAFTHQATRSCSGVSNGGVTNITLTPLEGSQKQLGKVNKLGNALQR